MAKCPKCGKESKEYLGKYEGYEVWFCEKCDEAFKSKPSSFKNFFSKIFERKKTRKEESKEGEEEKKKFYFSSSVILRAFLFFGIILASGLLILFSLLGMIQKEISKLFPDFPTLQYLPYVVFFALTAYGAYKLAKKSFFKGLIYCFILIIILILVSALIIELPKILPNQPINNTTTNGYTIMDPIQNEGYYAFDFLWGSKETDFETRFPTPIRKDSETIYRYIFPITIKNPSWKKSIKDFYFLPGTGLFNTSDMLIQELYPNLCTEEKKCEIAPRDTYVIDMDSKTEINYKINTLRIKINTSLSSANFGNNTFVFIRSRHDEKIAPTYQPYTGEGPISVGVNFIPVRYVFEYMSSLTEIRVVINLKNKWSGVGRIRKITIIRLGDPKLLQKPEICQGSMGDYAVSSIDERSEYIEFSFPITLATYPQTYLCDYTVPEEVRNNKITSPFETITFVVVVEYTYENVYEKEVRVSRLT